MSSLLLKELTDGAREIYVVRLFQSVAILLRRKFFQCLIHVARSQESWKRCLRSSGVCFGHSILLLSHQLNLSIPTIQQFVNLNEVTSISSCFQVS